VEEEADRGVVVEGRVDTDPVRVHHGRRVGGQLGAEAAAAGVVGDGGGQPDLVARAQARRQRGQQEPAGRVRDHDGLAQVAGQGTGQEVGVAGRRAGGAARHLRREHAVPEAGQGGGQRAEPGRGLRGAVDEDDVAHPPNPRDAGPRDARGSAQGGSAGARPGASGRLAHSAG
jgi:hypothetical protein